MIVRILTGFGLLALGYYVGREIGRAEPIRNHLEQSRKNDPAQTEAVIDKAVVEQSEQQT